MLSKEEHRDNIFEFRFQMADMLRKMRVNRELTIEQVSEKSKISERHLKNIEIGHFNNMGSIFQLARFYGKKIKIEFY